MTSTTFVMLSFGISHGLPLAFAVRELLTLRRGRGGGGDGPPPEPRLPLAPRPLPECLLPKPVTAPQRQRVRVLEDA